MEQSSYEARLHEDIQLVCTFSKVKSLSDLHVIWRRIEPKPDEEVYRYRKGRKMQNFTDPQFRERAHLIHEQLNQNRAVLQLKKLRIKDSGIYQCIVKVEDDGDYDGDYKDIKLSVTGESQIMCCVLWLSIPQTLIIVVCFSTSSTSQSSQEKCAEIRIRRRSGSVV